MLLHTDSVAPSWFTYGLLLQAKLISRSNTLTCIIYSSSIWDRYLYLFTDATFTWLFAWVKKSFDHIMMGHELF